MAESAQTFYQSRQDSGPDDQVAQVNLLIEAELRGRLSHGLMRLPRLLERIRDGLTDPVSTGAQTWRGNALLDVDGERGLGPVVAFSALNEICECARTTDVVAVVIKNSNQLGMLALYVKRIAERGLVLIALPTSEALVHP